MSKFSKTSTDFRRGLETLTPQFHEIRSRFCHETIRLKRNVQDIQKITDQAIEAQANFFILDHSNLHTTKAIEEISDKFANSTKNLRQLEEVQAKFLQESTEQENNIQIIANLVEQSQGQSLEARTSAEDLVAKIKKISKIADMINDISEQSNRLAIHTSIEAARSSEKGVAFSALANEMQRIASLAASVSDVVKEMFTGLDQDISEVASLTANTANTLEETHTNISKITDNVARQKGRAGQFVSCNRQIRDDLETSLHEVQNLTLMTRDFQKHRAKTIATLESLNKKLDLHRKDTKQILSGDMEILAKDMSTLCRDAGDLFLLSSQNEQEQLVSLPQERF